MHSDQSRTQQPNDRAEAMFKRKQDGDAAMAEYKTEAQAVEAKTARLRALRLAKEAADREIIAAQARAPAKRARRPKSAEV